MKKLLLSLLLFMVTCFAFSKAPVNNDLKEKQDFKKYNTISKKYKKNLNPKKDNFKRLVEKNIFFCTMNVVVWAQTFELECEDGGCSTYICSGFAWEIDCPEMGVYDVFCTDVESEEIIGC
jgi:hypothetical protein